MNGIRQPREGLFFCALSLGAGRCLGGIFFRRAAFLAGSTFVGAYLRPISLGSVNVVMHSISWWYAAVLVGFGSAMCLGMNEVELKDVVVEKEDKIIIKDIPESHSGGSRLCREVLKNCKKFFPKEDIQPCTKCEACKRGAIYDYEIMCLLLIAEHDIPPVCASSHYKKLKRHESACCRVSCYVAPIVAFTFFNFLGALTNVPNGVLSFFDDNDVPVVWDGVTNLVGIVGGLVFSIVAQWVYNEIDKSRVIGDSKVEEAKTSVENFYSQIANALLIQYMVNLNVIKQKYIEKDSSKLSDELLKKSPQELDKALLDAGGNGAAISFVQVAAIVGKMGSLETRLHKKTKTAINPLYDVKRLIEGKKELFAYVCSSEKDSILLSRIFSLMSNTSLKLTVAANFVCSKK